MVDQVPWEWTSRKGLSKEPCGISTVREQDEEEAVAEKTEGQWARSACDRLFQVQSLARMTSWTGSRLLSFQLITKCVSKDWVSSCWSFFCSLLSCDQISGISTVLLKSHLPLTAFQVGKGPSHPQGSGYYFLRQILAGSQALPMCALLLPLHLHQIQPRHTPCGQRGSQGKGG